MHIQRAGNEADAATACLEHLHVNPPIPGHKQPVEIVAAACQGRPQGLGAEDNRTRIQYRVAHRKVARHEIPRREDAVFVQIGKAGLAYFRVKNNSDHAIRGRAAYNITPEAAAAYFIKTQCFCFSDQTLAAGQEAEFPVIFFVDPKFATDPSTTKLDEIVLSYTFFPAPPSGALAPGSVSKSSAEMKKVPPKVG